jgi:hypothetical protein
MKNLFERMTAEIREKFDIAMIDYPSTLSSIKKDLQKNYWVSDLQFKTVLDFNFYVLNKIFDISKVFNSFEMIDSID